MKAMGRVRPSDGKAPVVGGEGSSPCCLVLHGFLGVEKRRVLMRRKIGTAASAELAQALEVAFPMARRGV